ncbi:MAG: hypothetical protein LBF13_03130, partial [Campylobacteraceae bacterium]|nr:hypothetical protein [Campylobacteraceae bacterium]
VIHLSDYNDGATLPVKKNFEVELLNSKLFSKTVTVPANKDKTNHCFYLRPIAKDCHHYLQNSSQDCPLLQHWGKSLK